jgi:hypothetical protein
VDNVEIAETHRANDMADRRGECTEHIHRRIKPVCQPAIAAPRWVNCGNLLSEHVDDCTGRIAIFEGSKEWIELEVLASLLFISI